MGRERWLTGLLMLGLLAGVGCRSFCERHYQDTCRAQPAPCCQPCGAAPVTAAVPVQPVPVAGQPVTHGGCTCTCPQ